MFPEELPKRLIKMFSFIGDTVLDPFLGSGTTSLAAKNLNRNSVGYELNPKFIDIAKQKLGAGQNKMFGSAVFDFVNQGDIKHNYKEDIAQLPYIFKDPLKFDKKIDPKNYCLAQR